MFMHQIKYISMCCTGATLLPDPLLDKENSKYFRRRFLEPKRPAADNTVTMATVTPEAVFKIARSLITPDVVQKVKTTFLFVVGGEHPGE